MIIFENTETWGLEHAMRGVRNPLNSWEKSDSEWSTVYDDDYASKEIKYIIGPNDLELCQRLIKGGSEHRKFLRQIMVSVDITAPLYWWKEFDTYKVGTVANSCSTMHTIHKKEFTLEDFSIGHLMCYIPEELRDDDYNEGDYKQNLWWKTMEDIVDALNVARDHYIRTKDKQYWYAMIQLLPSSYNQKRTVTMNYENLRSMYFQRKAHKLDEWREGFCGWINTLPYAKELIIFEG